MKPSIDVHLGYFYAGNNLYTVRFRLYNEESDSCINLSCWHESLEMWITIGTVYRHDHIIGPLSSTLADRPEVREVLNHPVNRLLLAVFDIEVPGGS